MAAPALKLLVLLASALNLAASAAPRSAYCPDGCQCVWLDLVCDDAGLAAVPTGDIYSYVTTLFLSGNNISALPADAFAPFPKLSTAVLNHNALSVLDLSAFERSGSLNELRLAHNEIASILPVDAPNHLRALVTLDLSFNLLRALDPHIFDETPSLRNLNLEGNPLVLPSGGPLLVHSTVAALSLAGVVGSALSPLTLSALPNLFSLNLNGSQVRSLSRAFAALPDLFTVELQNNDIVELPADAFAPETRLDVLNLNDNPLETIELPGLTVLRSRTSFSIVNTTIACTCAYEDVWEWSQQHGAQLNATCSSAQPCNIGKTTTV